MNGWTVDLTPTARRDLRHLDGEPRKAALDLIEELRESGPIVPTAIELDALPDRWRARFYERYRLVYLVSRTRKHIVVTRVLPRSLAYIGLKKPGPKKRKPKPNPSGKQRPMTRAESERGLVCQGGSGCVNPPKFMLEIPDYDPNTGQAGPGSRKIFLCGVHARNRSPRPKT